MHYEGRRIEFRKHCLQTVSHILHSVHYNSIITIGTNNRHNYVKFTVIQNASNYMYRALLHNCVLLDDGPVVSETCTSWWVVLLLF
jgi:hypothetical protein